MIVQLSSRRLSYFSCLPNRHMSSFMSILGQGINHSSIHNLPSAKTHIPFSVIHAFNNLLFSQCINIYVYIIKRKERAARVFPLFVLFHLGTHTTAVAFHALILFHFTMNSRPIPLGHDTQCLRSILDLSTMEPPHMVCLSYQELHSLTRTFFITAHSKLFRIVTCPHAPLG